MADPAILDKAFHYIMQSFLRPAGRRTSRTGFCTKESRSKKGDSSFTISKRLAIRSFFILRRIRSSPLLHLITCLTNIAFPSMGSKNGSPSEGLKRWRSAGWFQAKQ